MKYFGKKQIWNGLLNSIIEFENQYLRISDSRIKKIV